jgi:hypothetical protein
MQRPGRIPPPDANAFVEVMPSAFISALCAVDEGQLPVSLLPLSDGVAPLC